MWGTKNLIQAPATINNSTLALTALADIPLMRGLSLAELARIRGNLRMVSLPAGTGLLTLGQPGEIAYIILTGRVELHTENDSGDEVVLAILGPGEVVGEMSLVDRAARSVSATTMEESTFASLDRASFRECIQSMPGLARNLVSNLSRRLQAAHSRIEMMSTESVPARVAYFLLQLAREQGEVVPGGGVRIPVRLTQGDLSRMAGATRVSVNQVITGLRERGVISTAGDYRITVHNIESLAATARAGTGRKSYIPGNGSHMATAQA